MIAYLDTSILIPFYAPETLSDTVDEYIAGLENPAVSSLTEVEFYSAISKKIRTNKINNVSAGNILTYFNNHLTEHYFKRFTVSTEHYQKAKELIGQLTTSLRAMDALHLVISAQYCDLFVTADKALADAASIFGIRTKILLPY